MKKVCNLNKIDKFVKSQIGRKNIQYGYLRFGILYILTNILSETEDEIKVDAYDYISN